jgi:putative transposase
MTQMAYDHRIRDAVRDTRNIHLFPELAIPESTRRSWVRRARTETVELETSRRAEVRLRQKLCASERRAQRARAHKVLRTTVLHVARVELDHLRVPAASDKAKVLRAVAVAKTVMPLAEVLAVVGLSAARYRAWRQAQIRCELDDRPSCPRSRPTRLTAREVLAMKSVVLSPAFRHFSIRAMALHAARIGTVVAHAGTWGKMIRCRGWVRPTKRLHPPPPRESIRAGAPNGVWHVDVTVIRQLDGSKLYLHGLIDNFSRRILGWKLARKQTWEGTRDVLKAAALNLAAGAQSVAVVVDAGSENLNRRVDGLFSDRALDRIIAQRDVIFSNSMIEAWWRSLKHRWLYLNRLSDFEAVRKLVEFYVTQHNEVMPHHAFKGQTPDEMYFGGEEDVDELLALRRVEARRIRVAENQRAMCGVCPRPPPGEPRVDLLGYHDSSVISQGVHLRE